ncbi:MAG: PspC domain-containing protein [Acidobacteriota bacterium]
MGRRLVRNPRDAMVGGVAAGLGDYLDVDPVIIRLVFVLLCLAGGSGVLLYLVCWLLMPRSDPDGAPEASAMPTAEEFADEVREAGERVADTFRRSASGPGRGRLLAGAGLIAVGVLFLIDRFVDVWWLDVWRLWPLLLVAAGVAILLRSRDQGGA